MTTKELDLDNLTNLLAGTTLLQQDSGVSFAGKSLKLNNEDDAKEVVDAILECKNLIYLNLEGNTLGVDAAKGIAKALESHPEFKRALWKDIFTGRLKEEIPEALRFLGSGLVLAGATLTELNLSDNAFGPIGVDGLASLLKSPVCFALQELKLNNNGLGITGGRLLSKALMKCYESSKELNKPLALKVFIAGRNRLENEGAKALSEVFKTLGTLEEIIMPQNGIYHIGITALADALISNQNLRVLDLNDNTVSKKGSIALAKVLPMLQQLTVLNLGDCLLKTSGALSVASALKEHKNLQEVHLACNEINKSGGLAIADVLAEKKTLNKLVLDGNQFGENGIDEIKAIMSTCSAVTSISEDDGSEDEDEEEGDEEEEEEEQADEDKGSEEDENNSSKENNKSDSVLEQNHNNVNVTAADFFCTPTPEKFLSLGNNRTSLIIDEIKKQPDDQYLETLMSSLMKVSSLATSNNTNIQSASLACSDALYQELFIWASSNNQSSLVNNSLLVHLGLLKSEDKKFKVVRNIEGCKTALEHAMKQSYFPSWSKDMIKFFLDKKTKTEIPTVVL